jgi:hypothetical protein
MTRTSASPIGSQVLQKIASIGGKDDDANAMNITISVSNEADATRPQTADNSDRPNVNSPILPVPLERAQSSPIHSQIDQIHSRTMPLSGIQSQINRQVAASIQPFNFLLHLPANTPSPSQTPLTSPKSEPSPSPRSSSISTGYSPTKISLKKQLSIDTHHLPDTGNRPITPSFSSTLPGSLRQSRQVDISPGKGSPSMSGVSGYGLGLRSPISQRRSEFIEASLNALSDEELLLLCNKAQMRLFARLQQANANLRTEALYL